MYPSHASQSGALIDNVFPDAVHRDGEDTCVDGGSGAVAHSAMTPFRRRNLSLGICVIEAVPQLRFIQIFVTLIFQFSIHGFSCVFFVLQN